MKQHRVRMAFTVIELVLVIAIIAILSARLLPAIDKGKKRAKEVACMSNLRQAGIGSISYQHDHNGLLPHQVSLNEGGMRERFFDERGSTTFRSLDFYKAWQPMSNLLSTPKILVCPSDNYRRVATDFATMNHTNLSYMTFIYPATEPLSGTNALAGDGLTTELHRIYLGLLPSDPTPFEIDLFHGAERGNMLFSDGHVERLPNHDISWWDTQPR